MARFRSEFTTLSLEPLERVVEAISVERSTGSVMAGIREGSCRE